MPTVSRLNVAPVRSLGLEQRESIDVTDRGVVEDRRFYLIDPTDRLVDQLIEATLVQIGAWTNPEATRLRLTFPDGTVIDETVALDHHIESPIHGRTAVGHVVQGPWAAAVSDFLDREVRLVRCERPGGTRTNGMVSLVSDGSLDALGSVLGVGAIDARRFRMLIELAGGRAHEEDAWVGSRIGLGTAVIRVGAPVARCAITTHDPDTGTRDMDTLRALKDYRGLVDGKDLMFGVWGDVEEPGTIRLGDEVRRLD